MENIWNIILTTSYQATIVGILILSIKYLLKNKLSPRWGYLLWVVFLLKFIIPFGPESDVSIFNRIPQFPNTRILIEEPQNEINKSSAIENKVDTKSSNTPILNENTVPIKEFENHQNKKEIIQKVPNFSSYIPYIWMSGAINIIALFILVYTALNIKLSKGKIQHDERLEYILECARKKSKTGKRVKLIVSDEINTPALISILSPKILLPLKMVTLEDKELEYIFLHELSHYKRNDILVNYIILVIKAIHWFNPIIWHLLSKVRDDIELATDEKVLMILENKEHKEYARSIISVIEKSNQSLFYPTLMSMANDKSKLKKRIRSIKGMKNIKSKTVLFTVVGVLAVGITAPIMLTTSRGESSKVETKKESHSEKGLTNIENDYSKIVKAQLNGDIVNPDKIKELVSDKKLTNVDGYVSSAFNSGKSLMSVEFGKEKEKVSVAYTPNLDGNLVDIHYLNTSKNGYLNGIHAFYDTTVASDHSSSFFTKVGSVSVEDQKNLVEYIDESSKNNELFKTYYKFAKIAESSVEFPKEEIAKIDKENIIDLGENQLAIKVGKNLVTLIGEDNMKYIKGVKLNCENMFLYTQSKIGKGVDVIGEESNTSMTEIYSSNFKEQENILAKLNNNIQESVPKEVVAIEDIDEVDKEIKSINEFHNMELIKKISYSSEVNPKILTMKESIEYVKENTHEDIKEVNSKYEGEVGVTQTTYRVGEKEYIARYMHPYKDNENEYDKNSTAGIFVYESIKNK